MLSGGCTGIMPMDIMEMYVKLNFDTNYVIPVPQYGGSS